MQTYIIESCGYYKIGRTLCLNDRIKQYETHNPNFKLITIINCDCELLLHRHFITKRYKNEWFSLNDEDVKYIIENTEIFIEISSTTVEYSSKSDTRKAYFKRIREQVRIEDRIRAEEEYKERLENSRDFGIIK